DRPARKPEIRARHPLSSRRAFRRGRAHREAAAHAASAARPRSPVRPQIRGLTMNDDTAVPAPAQADAVPAGAPDKGKGQRKREKHDVHGWVVLDKPVGMTSTHAVSVVKRLFTAKRAGHAGTLDPLASGCLPIALGEATKTVPFVMDGRKAYRFTACWGDERDTDDADGRA